MKNGFFGKFFGKTKESSRDIAKKRLQFALIYDKLEVSDEILEALQKDIVDVISKYFEIDKNSLKLDIKRQDDLSALELNTPILSAKRKSK
ncbi:MAG: cell division topological specificity factor MinE [Desulforegulaceae bacterium]|nr:cell division topological specificity factor MinE [Desulforegulaceae bacterium]